MTLAATNLRDEPVSLCQFPQESAADRQYGERVRLQPQYEGLEKLYRRYRDKGSAVLAFPANETAVHAKAARTTDDGYPPHHALIV